MLSKNKKTQVVCANMSLMDNMLDASTDKGIIAYTNNKINSIRIETKCCVKWRCYYAGLFERRIY